MTNEAYVRMTMNAQQAGREIERRAIYPDDIATSLSLTPGLPYSERGEVYRDGIEIAKMSVDASQNLTRQAQKRSFVVNIDLSKDKRVTDKARRFLNVEHD